MVTSTKSAVRDAGPTELDFRRSLLMLGRDCVTESLRLQSLPVPSEDDLYNAAVLADRACRVAQALRRNPLVGGAA